MQRDAVLSAIGEVVTNAHNPEEASKQIALWFSRRVGQLPVCPDWTWTDCPETLLSTKQKSKSNAVAGRHGYSAPLISGPAIPSIGKGSGRPGGGWRRAAPRLRRLPDTDAGGTWRSLPVEKWLARIGSLRRRWGRGRRRVGGRPIATPRDAPRRLEHESVGGRQEGPNRPLGTVGAGTPSRGRRSW